MNAHMICSSVGCGGAFAIAADNAAALSGRARGLRFCGDGVGVAGGATTAAATVAATGIGADAVTACIDDDVGGGEPCSLRRRPRFDAAASPDWVDRLMGCAVSCVTTAWMCCCCDDDERGLI